MQYVSLSIISPHRLCRMMSLIANLKKNDEVKIWRVLVVALKIAIQLKFMQVKWCGKYANAIYRDSKQLRTSNLIKQNEHCHCRMCGRLWFSGNWRSDATIDYRYWPPSTWAYRGATRTQRPYLLLKILHIFIQHKKLWFSHFSPAGVFLL